MAITLVVVDALAAYKIGVLDRRPPHFSVGGVFQVPSRGKPPSLADGPFSVFGKPGPPTSLAAPGRTGPTSTTTAATRTTTGAVASATDRGSPGASPVASNSAAGSLPALGTYTWDVSGTEGATGFGSRNFPPQMTMVVHKGTSDPAEVVLDLTYSSDHQEREILGYRAGGVYFDYEAGQVRFGPMAQSNEGTYKPALLQVPVPLAAGRTYSGTAEVTASDGSTERTEAWSVTVNGPVTLQVGGQQVTTWQVTTERHSLPGSSQSDDRTETYWFDPARHLWVKFAEKQHGQQTIAGFTFTYDEQLVASLSSYAAE